MDLCHGGLRRTTYVDPNIDADDQDDNTMVSGM
jgi:hypothetical protein